MNTIQLLNQLLDKGIYLSVCDNRLVRIDTKADSSLDVIMKEIYAAESEVVGLLRKLPLSCYQQEIYQQWNVDEMSADHNIPVCIALSSKPDIKKLEEAWQHLLAKFPQLNAQVADSAGRSFLATGQWANKLSVENIKGNTTDAHIAHLLARAKVAFLPDENGLSRIELYKADKHRSYVLLTVHGILMDYKSVVGLMNYFVSIYTALQAGKKLPKIEISLYAQQYLSRELNCTASDLINITESYFRDAIGGSIPPFKLSPDITANVENHYAHSSVDFSLGMHLVNQIKGLSELAAVPVSQLLQATLNILLYKYTNQNEIVIGMPSVGDANIVVKHDHYIPVLEGIDDSLPVLQFIKAYSVKVTALQDQYKHSLLRSHAQAKTLRNSSGSITFDYWDNVEHAFEKVQFLNEIGGKTLSDLDVIAVSRSDNMDIAIHFNTHLYSKELMSRLMEHFANLLGAICADPVQSIRHYGFLGEQEQRIVVEEFNATRANFPQGQCLHDLFVEQVAKMPNATAIIYQNDILSYGQFYEKCSQLACYLQANDVGPEVLVGVCMSRTPDMLVAMMGIIMAGGAYVPLDPDYPEDRLSYIVQDSRAKIVLTQESLVGKVKALNVGTAAIVALDSGWEAINQHWLASDANKVLSKSVNADNLAYIIYTSGSTGMPKGVAIEHHSPVTLIHWANTIYTSDELAGVLASTSICFDLSVYEIFLTLSVGGKIILVKNALELESCPARNQVTLINTVPSAMDELVRLDAVPDSVVTINLAGEPLLTPLVNKIYDFTKAVRVYDLYGPSEDTTYSTFTLRTKNGPQIIGRPIANTQVYILDQANNPMPVGLPGELHISGDGLARCYLNRDDLTAQKFVVNPFNTATRMYKTGDLARWLPNGTLEYKGRIDNQVKIRGFRIEIGEVEAKLNTHPWIKECVVVAQSSGSDKRLIAFYVLKESANATEVKRDILVNYLQDFLPLYMVPAAFVRLDAIPLTQNGKTNRKLLESMDVKFESDVCYQAPSTDIEIRLAGLWAQALNVAPDSLGVNDNFFALGGHSLLVTRLASLVRNEFSIEVSQTTIFSHATIAELAKYIAGAEQSLLPAFMRVDRNTIAKKDYLSSTQRRLWVIGQLDNHAAYNVPKAIVIHEAISRGALDAAFKQLIARHEVLRTIYPRIQGEAAAHIADTVDFAIRDINLAHLSYEEAQVQARDYCQQEAGTPIALTDLPLMRVALITLRDNEHILMLNMHHIISDDWALAVLLADIFEFMDAAKMQRSVNLPELPIQYLDYSIWHGQRLDNDGVLKQQLDYWQQKLAGMPDRIELATDYPRPVQQSFSGAQTLFALDARLTANLKRVAEQKNCTLYMLLLTAVKTLLVRYTGQEDICLGGVFANRQYAETENLIGMFVNTLPLRTLFNAEDDIDSALKKVRSTCLEAYEYQDTPFDRIVDLVRPQRDLSMNPLFQIMVILQNVPIEASLGERVSAFTLERDTSKFDMTIEFTETDAGISGLIEYCTSLFSPATIKQFSLHLHNLCELFGSGVNAPISTLTYTSSAERELILSGFNNTVADYPKQKCVHQLFADQAGKTPDRIAVCVNDESLTYAQLYQKSNALAAYLRQGGIGANQAVGVCLDRSPQLLVGVLGVLQAGAAYIPMDPANPVERLKHMLLDSQASRVLTQQHLLPLLSRLLPEGVQIIALDDETIFANPDVNFSQPKTSPQDLSYVIYTSGSTGNPKGTANIHQGFMNLNSWYIQALDMIEDDRILVMSNPSFDLTQKNLIAPLLVGASIYLVAEYEPVAIRQLIKDNAITWINCAPSSFYGILQDPVAELASVRRVVLGGEPIQPQKIEKWFKQKSAQTKLFNSYGPTECSDVVSAYEICDLHNTFPIGKPINNTQIYILDAHGNPTAIGVPGELHIAGDGVSRGYLHKEELTREKFIANPFIPGTRMYRSGDLAKWLPDGNIEYLGRIDTQVKIRGFRIELGEIESAVEQLAFIDDCVVVAQGTGTNKKLVGFYVLKEDSVSDDAIVLTRSIKAHLQQLLPEYMVPVAFVSVAVIPLTPNGKVDRRKLESIPIPKSIINARANTKTEMETFLLTTWANELGMDKSNIGLDENFFDLGGNSVNVISLADSIQRSSFISPGLKFTPAILFKHNTVAAISQYLAEQAALNSHDVSSTTAEINTRHQTVLATDRANEADLPDYYQDSLAIIGISCQFPDAQDHWQFWENLKDGKESPRLLTQSELAQYQLVAEIEDHPAFVPLKTWMEGKEYFDPEFFKISSGNASLMDPQLRHLLMHSWKSVEDAGYLCDDIAKTAVFMSASNNSYQSLNNPLPADANVMESSEEFVSWTLAQSGTIPTMVSYHLGFTGPSVFVHSNCSSSLIGLYAAAQSLLTREADFALVGAAALSATMNVGYLYQPGLNLSSDGHLKAFDASADGMVEGEGVCVVLVRRLVDAIAAKDHIYTVVRGIGINNDGADKAGFYAPSVKGQSDIIRQVLDKTGVHPESISYVEAHGTGTALGDPIEIMGLSEAYAAYTNKKQFCAISSTKPNVGHLDAVAGLVGCVKIALGFYNRCIPGIINYKNPNPQIDFNQSPFYVLEHNTEWQAGAVPKRAAISSFGIGGTNAHAILEEYIQDNTVIADSSVDSECLVILSARKADNLRDYAKSLLAYLESPRASRATLQDIAYTLQTGRRPMAARVAFLASSLTDLKSRIASFLGAEKTEGYFYRDLNLLASADELVDKDEDFQELIKHWITKGKLKQLAKVWVNGAVIDWSSLYSDKNPDADVQPKKTSLPSYPFARESYWITNNISAQESGHKKSVASTVNIHPLLHANTSDFLQQRYTSLFTGQEFFLAHHQIQGNILFPAVGYLEMARAAIVNATPELPGNAVLELRNLAWIKPLVVTEKQSLSVSLSLNDDNEIHFAIHADAAGSDNSNRYCEGYAHYITPDAQTILDLDVIKNATQLGQVSAGDLYPAFIKMGTNFGPGFQGVHTIHQGHDQVLAELRLPEFINSTLDDFKLHPCLIDSALQAGLVLIAGVGKLPSATTLPFALESLRIVKHCVADMLAWVRYSPGSTPGNKLIKLDIDLCDHQGNLCVQIKGFSSRVFVSPEVTSELNTGVVIAAPQWEETPLTNTSPVGQSAYSERHLLLCGFSNVDAVAMQATAVSCTLIKGDGDTLAQGFGQFAQVCFNKIKAIIQARPTHPVFIQVIAPDDAEGNMVAGLMGLLTTANLENPKVNGQIILVEPNASMATISSHAAESVKRDYEKVIRYRNGQRSVRRWQNILVESQQGFAERNVHSLFKEGGVYVITGGLGAVGSLFARDIFNSLSQATVIITGRYDLATHKTGADKFATLVQSAKNHKVVYRQLDLGKLDAVQALIDSVIAEYGTLHGIIHSAGMISDSFILKKTSEEFSAVLEPKVTGSENLDRATRALALDFMVLFSSESSFGSLGQADYAIANGFMNEFAYYRNQLVHDGQRQGATLAINWPFWADGGMRIDDATKASVFQSTGMQPMTTAVGIKAFHQSLITAQAVTLVMPGNVALINKRLDRDQRPNPDVPVAVVAEKLLALPASDAVTGSVPVASSLSLKETTNEYLTAQLADVFKIPATKIDVKAPLENYGIDSILAIDTVNKLETSFGALSKTLLFEYQTVAELADYFVRFHEQTLLKLFAAQKQLPAVASPVAAAKNDKAVTQVAAPFAQPVAVTEKLFREKTQVWLCQIFADLFKRDASTLDPMSPLENYGIDSILAIGLTNKMEENFGALSKTLLFEYQTIAELGDYLIREFSGKLSSLLEQRGLLASSNTRATESVVANVNHQQDAGNIISLASGRRRGLTQDREPQGLRRFTATQHVSVEPIAIIGLSGRYPEAVNLKSFWENLSQGKDCITEIPASRWKWQDYFTEDRNLDGHHFSKLGGFIAGVDEFDAKFFNISPREAEVLDPQERIFLQHAWMAVEDAGYTRTSLQVPHHDDLAGQVGVYVGVMYGEYQLLGAESSMLGKRTGFAGSLADIANRVSYVMNLHGPSLTLDTMCSSSLTAIHLACQDLKTGRTDLAIAGGVNLNIHPNKYLILSAGQYVSSTGRCHSFGEGGDGYIPGEGVGAAILKRLSDAEADGDHIYGVIKGSALNHGGKTNGYTVPNPQAQASVITRALQDSGVDPRHISYIEAHGTGTKLGDPIEVAALAKAFGKNLGDGETLATGYCLLGSVKSNIGHCEPAAGIAGVTKVLLQMQYQKIAPSLHSSVLNPHIDFARTPFIVNQQLCDWQRPIVNGVEQPRIAGVSSFGAGGSNAHLIIEEYRVAVSGINDSALVDQDGKAVIPLSARTADQLLQKAEELRNYLQENNLSDLDLQRLAYTLQVGREPMEERLGILARSTSELTQKLSAFLASEKNNADIYVGQVRQHKKDMLNISQDDDMQEALGKWMQRRKLGKLIDLWVKGLELDWSAFYREGHPQKISLPTYPFAPDRHWFDIPTEQYTLTGGRGLIHPLLHVNTSTINEQRYSSRIGNNDEVVMTGVGKSYLLSTACLEMARAAMEQAAFAFGSESSPIIELHNMIWGQDYEIAAAKEVSISLLANDKDTNHQVAFEIFSHAAEVEETGVVHCQGFASVSSRINLESIPLAQLQQTLPVVNIESNADVGIDSFHAGNNQVLLHLRSSTQDSRLAFSPRALHTLLATALKFLAGGNYRLIAMEQVRFCFGIVQDVFAWIRCSNPHNSQIQLDVDLCDAQGNILIAIRGAQYLNMLERKDAIEWTSKAPSLSRATDNFAVKVIPANEAPVVKRVTIPAPSYVPFTQVMANKPRDIRLAITDILEFTDAPILAKPLLQLANVNMDWTSAPATDLVHHFESDNGIYVLDISAPENNQLSQNLITQLISALDFAAQSATAKVLVIRAAGAHFLNGGNEAFNLSLESKLFEKLIQFPYPVVAQADGVTTATGFLLASLCDFMVIASESNYAYLAVEQDFYATEAEWQLLCERFGEIYAYHLLYLNGRLSGSELQQQGWRFKIAPVDQLTGYVQDLAATLADKPRVALQLLKQHLSRHLVTKVEQLSPRNTLSSYIETNAVPEILQAIIAPAHIQMETRDNNILLVNLNVVSVDTIVSDLRILLEQVAAAKIYRAIVLSSSDDNFIPVGSLVDAISLGNLFQLSSLPIVAVLSKNATGLSWLVSQYCDACIYSVEGQFGLGSDLLLKGRENAALAKDVAALLGSKLGAAFAEEILVAGRLYSAAELALKQPLIVSAEQDSITTKAMTIATHFAHLSALFVQSFKAQFAAHVAQKTASLPGVDSWAAGLPSDAADIAPYKIPLASEVITATHYGNGILLVQMEDRESRNMHSQRTLDGVIEVFDHIDNSADYKAVILTGYDSYFSSGGTKEDLISIQEGKAKFTDIKIYHLALTCKVPVIAAMQGHGIGAGWALGMYADFPLFSEESRYLSPYMNFGFTPGAGATLALPGKVGYDLTRESFFSAREISGSEFAARGLSAAVLPRRKMLESALALAKSIVLFPRDYLVAIKGLFASPFIASLDDTYERELAMHDHTFVGQAETLSRIQNNFAGNTSYALDGEVNSLAQQSEPVVSHEPVAIREPAKTYAVQLQTIPVPDSASILSRLKKLLADELHMAEAEIDEDMQFVDLGLDSIYGVTWIRKVNETYGLSIEAIKVYSYPTLLEFSEFVKSELVNSESATGASAIGELVSGDAVQASVAIAEVPGNYIAPAPVAAPPVSKVIASVVASVSEIPSLAAVVATLKFLLANELHMDESEIDESVQFVDLGLDSIYGVTWVRKVNEKYQLDIEAISVYTYPTLLDFGQFVLAKIQLPESASVAQVALPPEVLAVVDAVELVPEVSGDVAAVLKALLADELHMAETEIDEEAQFVDLGLDSIYGVTWIRKINEKYALTIDAIKVYSYPTLAEFARYVQQELAKKAPTVAVTPAHTSAKTSAAENLAARAITTTRVAPATIPQVAPAAQFALPELESWRHKLASRLHQQPINNMTDPIAVIGMAGQFPLANNLDEFWDNIASSRNCIREVPDHRWSQQVYFSAGEPVEGKTNSKWMGLVDGYDQFDPLFFNLSPIEAEGIDPQQRLFLQTCWHSIEAAGYSSASLSGSKCGVFVGAGTGDYNQLSPKQLLNAQGFTGGAISILAARISYFLNLQGPCLTIDTACSSSLVALANACDSLNSGGSDIALAGGVYVMAGPFMHIKTAQSGMLSRDGKCFTFDQRANGFVPGEGAGVLMLKRLADAERDKDIIQGVVYGWGVNQDGKTNGITAPNADSQTRLQQDVYERFAIDPNNIQLIEAHGTGTKLGDPIEIEGLKNAFKKYTSAQAYCAIGSVKSNIGHCLAAAGVAGAIKVLLAIKHRKLPPTLHFESLNEHINLNATPFFVNDQLRDWDLAGRERRFAAISSFGFSGTNAHVVFAEYVPLPVKPGYVPVVNDSQASASANLSIASSSIANPSVANPSPSIVILSARTADQLQQKVNDLLQFVKRDSGSLVLDDLAYTLQVGRDPMEERLALLVMNKEELVAQLEHYLSGARADGQRFRGKVSSGKESIALINKDDEMKTLVDGWIANKKYQKLVELWVKGLVIDWHRLYGKDTPSRIEIPLYPFAQERYWLEESDLVLLAGSNRQSAEVLHPLLHVNTSNLLEQSYRSRFTGDEFFLNDHQVVIDSDKPIKVLPGVAYLEMVRAAVANAIPHSDDFVVELNNTAWIQPIRIDGPTEVSLILYPGNELHSNHHYEMDFEIYSGTGSREQLHCQGQAVLSRKQAPENISLVSLQGDMKKAELEPNGIYPIFVATGLHYGPAHRGISRIWVGERQALAELLLPAVVSQGFEQYGLHPSLMDSALQASIGLVEDPSHSALPFALESIKVFSPCVEKMYALVQLSQQPTAKAGLVKYDIALCDETGKVCVQMSGFSTRQLDKQAQPYKLHTVTAADEGSSSEDSYYQKLIELMQDGQVAVDDTVELGS